MAKWQLCRVLKLRHGDLLADPCTPFWAQRLIKELMDKDPLDAAQVLAVLAQSFGARAHKMLGGR
jgi:hypothetical protein